MLSTILRHGTFSPVSREKGMIVFVHGLTSSQHEPMIAQGAAFFNTHGYATFRFNLYGEAPDERKFKEVSLADHIADVNGTIGYFYNQGHPNIIVVGHSFGGLTLLYSDLTHVQRVVLRDASIGGDELLGDVFTDENGHYIDRGDDTKWYISETMYQDFCRDPQEHIKQITMLSTPISILAAEHGLQQPAQLYAQKINSHAIVIPGADHVFSDDALKKKLFEETLKVIE